MRKATVCLALISCVVCATVNATPAQQPMSQTQEEVVVIDGAKNPELVPEWAAWLDAFRVMSQPAVLFEPIPTVLFPVTTAEQRALVRKESLDVIAQETKIYERASKLLEGLTADNMVERAAKADELDMERRRMALEARDRLLAALPAAAQTALRSFLSDIRRGFTAYVPKSKVTQFRLPE